ncbi:lectin C-type domain-containing protein [Loa loa]|uniref:Lectin C-type domain-containing protein n=1 Tax=Loa loa TaxID=7209 RepID=A0A1S0TP18_LOALO|nr:lectin C-type domain-containing protein [Loa loa]EFO17341.1 lectin C-type domain-containing protein [Loa loa]
MPIAGGTSKSPEIVRWCGVKHPDVIISTTDSLYVYFHSDEAFQRKGINMSFIEFDMPGCPPNWISSSIGYCYILTEATHGLTWLEAQEECSLVRSNLLTLTSAIEYSSVAAIYTKSKTTPWIGYMDYSGEGRFTPVDPNSQPWPEDLPKLIGSRSGQECAYIDWRNRKGEILAVDDCRNRHEYICKRRQDGTTIPYLPQKEMMRNGLAKSPISFNIWLFIILLVLLTLILLFVCYRKCKKQRALSRIGSSDANQRLVTGIDVQRAATSATVLHIGSSEIQKTNSVAINNNGARNDARVPTVTENASSVVQYRDSSRQAKEQNTPSQNSHSIRQLNLERIEPTVLTIEPRFNARQASEERLSVPSRSKQNLPFGIRESTMSSTTREETLLKIRRGELFERPRVSVLDHTSAISLDEFWNKNEMSTINRN